jgi:hypothetical protein
MGQHCLGHPLRAKEIVNYSFIFHLCNKVCAQSRNSGNARVLWKVIQVNGNKTFTELNFILYNGGK